MNIDSTFLWFIIYYGLPVAFLCFLYYSSWWTTDGYRRWWKWILWKRKPRKGWSRLRTPGRVIYHCASSPEDDTVKRLFFEGATETSKIRKKIFKVLAKDSESGATLSAITEWDAIVESARCLSIYRREPLMAGGWAQTVNANTSQCILGMELGFCNLGCWTESAVGHELVHTAQEVREYALRKEWEDSSYIQAIWRYARFEGEAHLHFWLWPITLLFILSVLALLLLASWSDLWQIP